MDEDWEQLGLSLDLFEDEIIPQSPIAANDDDLPGDSWLGPTPSDASPITSIQVHLDGQPVEGTDINPRSPLDALFPLPNIPADFDLPSTTKASQPPSPSASQSVSPCTIAATPTLPLSSTSIISANPNSSPSSQALPSPSDQTAEQVLSAQPPENPVPSPSTSPTDALTSLHCVSEDVRPNSGLIQLHTTPGQPAPPNNQSCSLSSAPQPPPSELVAFADKKADARTTATVSAVAVAPRSSTSNKPSSGSAPKVPRLGVEHQSLKEKRMKEARQFPKEVLKNLDGTTSAEVRKMNSSERELVLYKRKLRNRESARRSRQKRQATLGEIQEEIDDLARISERMVDVGLKLSEENAHLKDRLDVALAELNGLRAFSKESSQKGAPSSTGDGSSPQATLKMKLGGWEWRLLANWANCDVSYLPFLLFFLSVSVHPFPSTFLRKSLPYRRNIYDFATSTFLQNIALMVEDSILRSKFVGSNGGKKFLCHYKCWILRTLQIFYVLRIGREDSLQVFEVFWYNLKGSRSMIWAVKMFYFTRSGRSPPGFIADLPMRLCGFEVWRSSPLSDDSFSFTWFCTVLQSICSNHFQINVAKGARCLLQKWSSTSSMWRQTTAALSLMTLVCDWVPP